jgi:hypothetical protein
VKATLPKADEPVMVPVAVWELPPVNVVVPTNEVITSPPPDEQYVDTATKVPLP